MQTPNDFSYYMPAEWSEHECCWMQWPTTMTPSEDAVTWSHFDLKKGRINWASVANTISKFEPVKMIVHPNDINSTSNLLNSDVKIIPLEINDAWCRDSGAIFLLDENNQLGGVDSNFNCWGYKINYQLDDQVAKFMIENSKAKYFKNNMVLEGGSIHVDGEGTLITTEQCLLHENRNPHLSKEEIENNLKDNFGVKKIIWLKHCTDEGTNCHIDNVACFVKPGTVMVMTCNDKSDTYYDRLNENLEILKTATDSSDRRLEVIEVEMSYKRLIPDDDEPCSYINYYIANGGIILPIFHDEKADQNAINIIQNAFPDRKVECVDGLDILLGGGGVHCITQQQTKAKV